MQGETSVARDEACIPRFELYTKDEGGYAGVALAFMKAKITGTKGEMILCVPNHGTVDWLEDSDIIEVSCNISKNGATPKKGLYELPECAKQLITKEKLNRQEFEAIFEQAIDALMINPLVNSYSLAVKLLGEYLEVYKEYTGGWTL